MENIDKNEVNGEQYALIVKSTSERKLGLLIDYQNCNPFKKFVIGGGITTAIGIGGFLGFGFCEATLATFIPFIGSIVATGIGAVLLIVPGLIASGGYLIWKNNKNKKLKDYYKKLFDSSNKNMAEEREIYLKVVYELINYFSIKYKDYFNDNIKNHLANSSNNFFKFL